MMNIMCNSRPRIVKGKALCDRKVIGKVIKNSKSGKKEECIQVLSHDYLELFEEGYIGYIFENEEINTKIEKYLIQNFIPSILGVKTGFFLYDDVIELNSRVDSIALLYKSDCYENTIVVTNQCNSNCIMCPDSIAIRSVRENVSIKKIKTLLSLISKDAKFICITGGEPTLLELGLFEILDECKTSLFNTQFIMLTNGRMFYYKSYVKEFIKHRPDNMIIAIPIHGHVSKLHDSITQSKGSFKQTITGVKMLHDLGENIEIRVVLSKMNYLYLADIAKLIIDKFPNAFRVNFMAMEMLGNAVVNESKVWIDLDKLQIEVAKASRLLIENGINTYLYNFPMCYVDERLWSITMNSISENKIRYREECKECKVINKCGGFFGSTMRFKSLKAKPI
ncbi:His-Xaa-Ser system radical SAM maturase HxsC [Clostridium estertheticum]|uniref:His-Xaa-Ser system radical SAM maturase HxsC n=1 Tax=Clostridium estertheticum TaxID=238834 RepID=UPI001CF45CB4|nr:His-Xaa-Ser system radical SAM maturase HxsC [Clostridium estertheticum]MCB2358619.1 His-Xaa-Ser system radical SAM maturase HxsC [Clostridium estertheticum]